MKNTTENQDAGNNTPEEIKAEKNRIRNEIMNLKAGLADSGKKNQSDIVFGKIELLPEFIMAETVFLYWSLPDELPTHAFAEKWSNKKKIVLPAVVGNEIVLKVFISENEMKTGALNISEPDTSENYSGKIDLIIVPGIAFDRNKNRLGRGKGFYDRFFKKDLMTKIGVGFDFQLKDSIPTDEFDVPMSKVITPYETIE